MTAGFRTSTNALQEIWLSFCALPVWVRIWVALILVPVNMASLFFLDKPIGLWVALLANIAMLANLPIILYERGFTKTMALPHLIPWTILVCMLLFARPAATGAYDRYLYILLTVDIISLLFDYADSFAWFRARGFDRDDPS